MLKSVCIQVRRRGCPKEKTTCVIFPKARKSLANAKKWKKTPGGGVWPTEERTSERRGVERKAGLRSLSSL